MAGRLSSGRLLHRARLAPTAIELAPPADLGGHAIDLAHSGLEGVADGERQLLVGVAADTLVADHDRPAARHADLDLDLIDLGLLRRAALWRLDAPPPARHALEMLPQLADLLEHLLVDGVALFDAVKMHLDLGHENGPFHAGTNLDSVTMGHCGSAFTVGVALSRVKLGRDLSRAPACDAAAEIAWCYPWA